ncbi:protein TolA [Nitrosospira lacus]|uniref:Protein TolA n=1 Tax=Nitrosospira lacus TaxID=1288494 RepID=A0A1W6ST58_9PROT|nr:cell envelope integrity protein TolA [Nitrosospira lacus]ARO88994.1 protein TolA [Nitrosospira lacus]
MALRGSSHIEPGRVPAGVLAVLVHIIFFAFMIFGLNWKTYPPEPMMVDLWSNLPQPEQSPVIKATPPPPVPKPVQPPPDAKPLPPEPKMPPPPPKPDIALKEKIEPKPIEKKQPAQKDQKEAKEKELKAQKEKEQDLKAQKEKELKDQQARVAAEIEQLQREQEARNKLQAQAAAQSRQGNEIAEYKARILAKIKSHIIMPPDLPGNPVAEFDVTLLPGGDILDVKLRRSSGFAAFDSAVERAIFLAKPLPLPPDPAMFPKFRNLSLKVHYRE